MDLRAAPPSRVGPLALQALVLVVAEELEQCRLLTSALAVCGLRSLQVGTSPSELGRALAHGPELVLVDARAAGERVVLIARIRAGTHAPILVLGNGGEGQRSALLSAGADECLFRPYGPTDLVLRGRAWLARTTRTQAHSILPESNRESLRLDRERRTIFVDGRPVHLTPLECKLVVTLTQGSARALRDEQIIETVWGGGRRGTSQLRALVRQVRQKIEPDPANPRHLLDAPGGYRLKLG